jgi:hypothetical protein
MKPCYFIKDLLPHTMTRKGKPSPKSKGQGKEKSTTKTGNKKNAESVQNIVFMRLPGVF